jgi:zinc/manganese transport system ATP-binding protein
VGVLTVAALATGTALAFRNLTLGYGRRPAVHHLSGTIAAGSLTAIVGPNGAGKSTLLKAIVGELQPLDGTLDRDALTQRDIAYLPQIAELDRSFPMSVFDLVTTGAWHQAGWFGGFGRGVRARAAKALEAVGLAGFENRAIGQLSGGQLQRALFARVMLQDAKVILLDEPFTAIDQKTTADLLALIGRWHGETRTILAVLHDLDLVRAHFPEALLLAREPVAFGPTVEALRPENLLIARRMLEAPDPHAAPCDRVA